MKFVKPTPDTPEGTDLSCGFFTLGAASVAAIGLGVLALYAGVRIDQIEQTMLLLSIPWFSYAYLVCRSMHRTKIVYRESENPIEGIRSSTEQLHQVGWKPIESIRGKIYIFTIYSRSKPFGQEFLVVRDDGKSFGVYTSKADAFRIAKQQAGPESNFF